MAALNGAALIMETIMEEFSRTEWIFKAEGMERLSKARVAVFGLGGVGGHAAEALVRSGIGAVDLIDSDVVELSNINRQIIALHSTVGTAKVDTAAERFLDINPALKIQKYNMKFSPENAGEFDFGAYDYVIDAIDDVPAKVELAVCCENLNVPIISSVGAGNYLDPTAFKIADIYSTAVSPLARVMRHELRKRGVKRLKTVYSTEPPIPMPSERAEFKKPSPASVAFVPSVAGLIIAGEVLKDIAIPQNREPNT